MASILELRHFVSNASSLSEVTVYKNTRAALTSCFDIHEFPNPDPGFPSAI